jgi:proteasome accessory factor B
MASPTSPQAKTERLLNLVMILLWARRPLPKAKLRESVAAYRSAPSDEAFERMFERDKDELRELGIPLLTEEIDAYYDDEPGYRIDRREYALPELSFEPDELAALGLASRAWQTAKLAGPAAAAIRKLEAVGLEGDSSALAGLEPRLRTPDESYDAVHRAVSTLTEISFDYRRPDGSTSTRHVQPWGLAQRGGFWYLTAFDTDRGEERVFRLSRITGRVTSPKRPARYTVPAGHDALASVLRSVGGAPETANATVRVRVGAGHGLRRRATATEPRDAQWEVVTVPYGDTGQLAAELASHGPDVVAESPPDLVAETVAHLRAVAEGGPV